MAEKKSQQVNNEESSRADSAAEFVSTHETTEETERITKNIAFGRKETFYEDGRNVISVIINAISVRINMPRGTVKALLACIALLLIVAAMLAWDDAGGKSGKTADKSAEATDAPAQREYVTEEEKSKAVNSERAAKSSDYVIISARYRYDLPEGTEGVWEPEDYYEENETYCDFVRDGDYYTIRSYLLTFINAELSDIVKASISQFDGYELIDQEYIDGKYGKVLKLKFASDDEDGNYTAVTGYYWSDIDPHICCLEVSSDEWRDGEVEDMIFDSVYRVEAETDTDYLVPDDAQEILDGQRSQEAMDSIAQDAMRDQYAEPEPETYPW